MFVVGDNGEKVRTSKGLTLAPDVAREVAQAMLGLTVLLYLVIQIDSCSRWHTNMPELTLG